MLVKGAIVKCILRDFRMQTLFIHIATGFDIKLRIAVLGIENENQICPELFNEASHFFV
jgi:hypothetical protein